MIVFLIQFNSFFWVSFSLRIKNMLIHTKNGKSSCLAHHFFPVVLCCVWIWIFISFRPDKSALSKYSFIWNLCTYSANSNANQKKVSTENHRSVNRIDTEKRTKQYKIIIKKKNAHTQFENKNNIHARHRWANESTEHCSA